jgi:FdhE protein
MRLRTLAEDNQLGPYLRFLSALSDCQHRVQAGLPEPQLADGDARARSREHGMPPLGRSHGHFDAVLSATLDHLLALAAEIDMRSPARVALTRVHGADDETRGSMVRAVLADSIPADALADHAYVAAALQVHFARQAARLDRALLRPAGDAVCPSCGAPPVASAIVGWNGVHGARFCACWLCSTLWHVVRIKCVFCGSTGGIGYQHIDGGTGTVKAETCDNCRAYLKVMHQHKDPPLEPVADDIATLALDLLVRETGYRRGAVNPFLSGY